MSQSQPTITEGTVAAALDAAKTRLALVPAAPTVPAPQSEPMEAAPKRTANETTPLPNRQPRRPASGARAPLPEDPIPLMMRMSMHYGWDGPIPENVIKALEGDGEPIDCVRRAIDRMFMFLLGKWARGEIPGPDTHDNLIEQAKQAEKLAKMFDKKGQPENAAKQRERAEELRTRPVAQSEDWFAKVRDA